MPEVTKYCSACGNGLIASAIICPKCGSPVTGQYLHSGKSKSTAVWLAVLFGHWGWLYTFRANSTKFFIGLILAMIASTLSTTGALLYIRVSQEWATCLIYSSPAYMESCSRTHNYEPFLPMLILGMMLSLSVWLWAVIDVSRKPNEFYKSYD